MPPTVTQANLLLPREWSLLSPGAVHIPGWLGLDGQRRLVAACYRWADGRLRAPRMANGSSMSVRIACLGWHWYPYRYSKTVDDDDGRPVAPFPTWLGQLAGKAVDDALELEPRLSGNSLLSSSSGCADVRRVRTGCRTSQLVFRSRQDGHACRQGRAE